MTVAAGETLVALLSGPDRPGIVATISSWIYERGGNIIHADQHRDQEEEIFFQRIEWFSRGGDDEAEAFREMARGLGMEAEVRSTRHKPRVALMVSRFDHCFHDVVLRWKAGEFRGELVCVVSNHTDLAEAAANYGLPYYHVPVAAATKGEAERQQLEIFRNHDVELIVMARYMQVLSDTFLGEVGCRVINIHHSFLPAFAGARPYHQAYKRGVKLIGATAHYATPVLDDGPIIHQDVARVTHRHNVNDLIRKGRDLEKMVLAQAVSWHLDNRILIYGRKTVVFD